MQHQSPERIRELMDQFPAIAAIHTAQRQRPELPTSITVQRADASLMYRRADNVGIGNHNGWIGRSDRADARGTRYEIAAAVGRSGTLLRILDWRDYARGNHQPFTKVLLLKPESVGAIVWLTLERWYETPSEEKDRAGVRFGKFLDAEARYTVYREPHEGWTPLKESASVAHNVELTSRALLEGVVRQDAAYQEASERLQAAGRKLYERVIAGPLNAHIGKATARGMSATFGEVQIMTYCLAGRFMVTLEAPTPGTPNSRDSVTFIGEEPPKCSGVGWQGILATCDRAVQLVDLVVEGWEKLPPAKRVRAFRRDDKVGIL